MLRSSLISFWFLLALATTSLAQNTAWIGCYAIPPDPISGISISSSNTWTAAGCAGECRTLPDFGFSPTTYSYFSPVVEIGTPIPTHCLCTNNVPDNEAYYGPSTPEDCGNDNAYSANLVDTSFRFQGCYRAFKPLSVAYYDYHDTVPECFERCSTYRWIAVIHDPTQSHITCICSHNASSHEIAHKTVCDPTNSVYLVYTYNGGVQPSSRANKRREKPLPTWG